MEKLRGYIIASSLNVKVVDGVETFTPFNNAYAIIHANVPEVPSMHAGNQMVRRVEIEIGDDEFFQVREDIDKSEGRGGTRPAGNYFEINDAFKAARHAGAQGGPGKVVIMTPDGENTLEVLDPQGRPQVWDRWRNWRPVSVASRVTILPVAQA